MKVLFDIGHPAHVHIFRNVARGLEAEGHEVVFTTREKEMAAYLLQHCGFRHINFGPHYRTLAGKVFGLLRFDARMVACIRSERPDILMSHGSMYAAQAAWLTGRPHVSLEDSENTTDQIRMYKPFTRAILTCRNFPLDFGKKQVRYDGYHELAYLHPTVYQPGPDPLGGKDGRKRVLVRLTAWEASHDAGQTGIPAEALRRFVKEMEPVARVLLSSEKAPSTEWEPYRLAIPPEKMHDLLSTLDLYVGEGATMASECSVLGVPSLYMNTQFPYYVREQAERYGLVERALTPEELLPRAKRILEDPGTRERCREGQRRLLDDCIDVTAFLKDFLTHFPASFRETRENNAAVMGRYRRCFKGAH